MRAKAILVLLFAGFATGCATQSFVFDPGYQAMPVEETSHFFISGLGQKDVIDVSSVCGGSDNVARVETHQSFLNGLLGFVTYGIYTPRQTAVYCKSRLK